MKTSSKISPYPNRKAVAAVEAASKREALLHSALLLFAEKGYAATSIREIARQAGISESLIYHHFQSKADLLYEIFSSQVSRIAVETRSAAAHTPTDDVGLLLSNVFDYILHAFVDGDMGRVFRIMLNSLASLSEAEKERFVTALENAVWGPFSRLLSQRMTTEQKQEYDAYALFRIFHGGILGYVMFQELFGGKKVVELNQVAYRNQLSRLVAEAVRGHYSKAQRS